MKLTHYLIAVAAAALLAAPAAAGLDRQIKQHRWDSMTQAQRHDRANRDVNHYRTSVRWWLANRAEFPTSKWGHYCPAIGIKAPSPVCRAGVRLTQALKVKLKIEARIARAKAVAAAAAQAALYTGAWECIHEHEGSWNANTGNGYYGGLQMDMGFMSTYGPKFLRQWGTADHWPVWAQIQAAQRAHDSGRGYSPWPNTAHACGLI